MPSYRGPIRDRAVTTGDAVSTPATVNYPTDVVSGDLLLAFIGIDTSQTTITASGWTQLDHTNGSDAGAIFYKTAAGTEGGSTFSVSFTTTGRDFSAVVYSLRNVTGTPEVSVATGTSATPTPPTLSPSGGSAQYLWLTGTVIDDTHYPLELSDGYGGWAYSRPASPSSGLYVAAKVSTAASETPSAHTLSASKAWIAWTVSVPVNSTVGYWPVIEGQEVTLGTTTSTAITLPSGVATDDLIVICTAYEANPTASMTGYIKLVDVNSGGFSKYTVFYRVATGADTATLSLGTADFSKSLAYRISVALDTNIEAVTYTSASTAAPDMGALTPAGGADNILWILGFAIDNPVQNILSWPARYYEGGYHSPSAGVSNYEGLFVAAAGVNDTSQDLEALSILQAARVCGALVAIYPSVEAPAGVTSYLEAQGVLQAMCLDRGHSSTEDFVGSLSLLAGTPGSDALSSLATLGATSKEIVGAINELAGTSGLELHAATRAWAESGNY